MPIRPNRYPANVRAAILYRAGGRCEQCGVANGATVERAGGPVIQIVLRVISVGHVLEHSQPRNVQALCQKCHGSYSASIRAARRTRPQARR